MYWKCANCKQSGYGGEWHGPGSSLCPIHLFEHHWECSKCGTVGRLETKQPQEFSFPHICSK